MLGFKKQEPQDSWFEQESINTLNARNKARIKRLKLKTTHIKQEFCKVRTDANRVLREKKRARGVKRLTEINRMAESKKKANV